MNPFNTYFLQAAIEVIPIRHTWFRDRYFPTDEELDVFGTSHVLADFRELNQKVAPFVLPRIGAIPATRVGFSVYDLEPMNIAVSLPLTIDNLIHRGFGESIMSRATPEDRARRMIVEDLADINRMIDRAEEKLAIQTILDNGATMFHRTDDKDIGQDISVKFYDGVNNPTLYTPGNNWAHSSKSGETWTKGNWYTDMSAMVRAARQRGVIISEFMLSQDVATWLLDDGWFLAMLDNRRIDMGRLAPEVLTDDVVELGFISIDGANIRILYHIGIYEDDSGVSHNFLPAGTVIGISPDVGRGLYGGVTLMDPVTKEFYTVAGRRVAEAIVTQRPPARETCVYAKPLFVPRRKAPWMVAKNVFGT